MGCFLCAHPNDKALKHRLLMGNAAARVGDERQCVSGEQRGLGGLISDSQPVLYLELRLFPREWF